MAFAFSFMAFRITNTPLGGAIIAEQISSLVVTSNRNFVCYPRM